MGVFDELKDKAEGLLKDHKEQVESAVGKVGSFVDDKTGGKHSAQIEQGVQTAKGLLGKLGDEA